MNHRKLTALIGFIVIASCKHDIYIQPPLLPTAITYAPDSLRTIEGRQDSSVVPVLNGSRPLKFQVVANPSTTAIQIDTSGRIYTTPSLLPGTYKASIVIGNAAGKKTFTDLFTIVNERVVTFESHIKPLVATTCAPCHTGGGQLTNYTLFANARARVDWILDRTQRSPTAPGFMPLNGSPVSADKIALINEWKKTGLLP